MAASMQDSSENEINSVIIQFFEMVPIRRMKLQSSCLSSQNLDVGTQQQLLSKTVGSEMCRKYPPALVYRKAFLKKLLQVLEQYGVDICDEIYEVYTELLQEQEGGEENLCYKTYTIDLLHGNFITIQESVNMVSFGTTGLSTWQAAQHLSEWIIEHSHLFQNKNILELGSGIGLTGIVTCRQCSVKSYTFTDHHKQVLEFLARNIQRNLTSSRTATDGRKMATTVDTPQREDYELKNSVRRLCKGTQEGESCDIPEVSSPVIEQTDDYEDLPTLCPKHWERHECFNTHVYRNVCGVRLAQLDWENLDEKIMDYLSDIDVVLAADVVYDTRIIPYLVSTIKKVLSSSMGRKEPACAYIASTIRNEDTRDQFLIALSTEGLNYLQVEGPQLQLFHYDKSVPIEILKITESD